MDCEENEGQKLEVSCAALMYSDIRHLLGIIEGAAMGVRNEKIAGAIFNSASLITDIIDEMYGVEPEDWGLDGEDDGDGD